MLSLSILSGCLKKDDISKVNVNNCNNTFVISAYWNIYLFEHNENSIDFKLLKSLSNYSNNNAIYMCNDNTIISSYSYKGVKQDKAGITYFNLNNESSTDYSIEEGNNGIVGRYSNGVLIDTSLIQLGDIKPNYFIPDNEIILNNTDNSPIHRYTLTHLFDLNKRKVIKSYEMNQGQSWVTGDDLYSLQINSVTKTNLESKTREKIFGFKLSDVDQQIAVGIPALTGRVMIDDSIYIITGEESWNIASDRKTRSLKGLKRNIIYQLIDDNFHEISTLPYGDISYTVSLDNHIYIFTKKSNKVMRYSKEYNELYVFDFDFDSLKYEIESVGYTDDNFIIVLSTETKDRTGGIIVANHDFTKISEIMTLNIDTNTVSITTHRDVSTMQRHKI